MDYFRVFLSSPVDVAHERSLARQVLENLANQPFIRKRAAIQIVAWDTPGAETPVFANLTPQEAINRQLPLPSDCDIAVVILWSRMGTPLPPEYARPDGSRYLSGTEWEFENALTSSKTKVLLYRRTEKVPTFLDDPDLTGKLQQYDKVKQFFANLQGPKGELKGGWMDYGAPSEFQERFENDIKSVLELMLEGSPSRRAHVAAGNSEWRGSPYPGLRAFTPEDALIFFGRGRETDDLIERIQDPSNRFICVVGASGTGKSSLVGAGLIPRLRANAVEGSKDWLIAQFSPGELGDAPFLPFAARLAPLIPDQARSAPALAERLLRDPASAGTVCVSALEQRPPWSRFLIFIDQLEELFTLVHERYQRPFAALIKSLADHERIRIVATLRADFLSRTAEMPELAGWLKKGHYLLIAPGWDGLESIIRGPAERSGLELEEGLVARILSDTGQEPGRLPLLAYALDQQYRAQATPGRLTIAGYEALGGIRGAIGRRAEESFAKLDEVAQAALPRLFGELVALDASGTVTRRRAFRERVADEGSRRLAEELVGCRLLSADQIGGSESIEVAHEALFESWPRLRSWLEQNREFLLWRERLRFFRSEWERTGRNEAALLHGPLLDEAMRWLSKFESELTANEKEFIRWTNTDEYQIACILPDGRDLWPYCDEKTRGAWFGALAYAGRFEEIPPSMEGLQAISRVAQDWAGLAAGKDALLTSQWVHNGPLRDSALYNIANLLAEAGDFQYSLLALQEMQSTEMQVTAAFYAGKTLLASGLRGEALAALEKLGDSKARTALLKSLEAGKPVSGNAAGESQPVSTTEPPSGGAATRKLASDSKLAGRGGPKFSRDNACDVTAGSSNLLLEIMELQPDSADADRLAARAGEAADGIQSPIDRASYLCDVAVAFLGNGSLRQAGAVAERAAEAIREIAAPRPIPLLRELTALLAKTGSTELAIDLVSPSEDPATQAFLLRELMVALAGRGAPAQIEHVAMAAMDALTMAQGAQTRASILKDLIPFLTKTEARDKLEAAAKEVIGSMKLITYVPIREELLGQIASLLAEAGIARLARAAAEQIEAPATKMPVLRHIATALANAGIADQALAAAKAVEMEYRSAALHETAVILARRGLMTESLKAASTIGKGVLQTEALCEVAIALAESGSVADAIETAGKIEQPQMRDFSLSTIATAAAQAGKAEDAMTAASRIPGPAQRWSTYRDVAVLLAHDDRMDLARGALVEAREAARQIGDEMERSDALSQIALGLARLAFYAEARLAAERCSSSRHRLSAYTAILREYMVRRRPELRKTRRRQDATRHNPLELV